MSSVIDEFGQNAGKVWQMLNQKGPLSETKLMNFTLLEDRQIRAAVGWLARENKICRNGTVYKIGGTNLVEQIGTDAGKIWSVLSERQREINISSLSRLTKINVNDVYLAIGWLARENKIDAKTVVKQKNNHLKVWLKR
ncbi:MAG: hypothetical protein BV458_04430 [Thermoplasmata archaeon M9B2D]|nr:MAG: hypothetical protein BV458_04430 [Thermoplasmata archaeon M9B2D]